MLASGSGSRTGKPPISCELLRGTPAGASADEGPAGTLAATTGAGVRPGMVAEGEVAVSLSSSRMALVATARASRFPVSDDDFR
jgi:hypothetical protein